MHNSSKKKEYTEIDNKRIRNSSDLKHTVHCSKYKNKIRHVSEQELPLIPPEILLDGQPKKHHCKKKKQQQQQQPHKKKENGLNKRVKKKKSLKIIDKPNSHIVNDLNKFFIVENNRLNDSKKAKHREYKEKDQHVKELLEKNNDLGIRGYINNLFEKIKIKPDSKQIDIIYTRSAKKQTQNREEHSKNDVLIKHNNIKRYSGGENFKHVKKEIKHNKSKSDDDEIKHIKKLILQEIKSEDQKCKHRKKLIDGTKRFDNFNGILDSELTVVSNSMIMQSQLVHSSNCIRSISVGVPTKSCYKMDVGCQVSMMKMTETHYPPLSFIPSTDLPQIHYKRNGERSSSLPSKIPVAINRRLAPNDEHDYDGTTCYTTSSRSRNTSLRSPQNDVQSQRIFRQKTLNIPPKVVEIQYLTDLARGQQDNFNNDWLNQKYYNFEHGKERLKIQDKTVQENQETDSMKDGIQSPRKHKLKIKENTFNINFKTQTKIHICQKSKRLNTRKYRKENRSFSRKKSTVSVKENAKQVSDAATNTENDISNSTESLNKLFRDNSDFLKQDFSYITESVGSSKFDGNLECGKTNADNDDRVLSLTAINQNLTSVKIENHENALIDFSTILNSRNDEYFTIKSIEDVLNQSKLEDYELKSSSLSSLESREFNSASLPAKNFAINEEICPKNEISLAKSEHHLEDRRNGRSEFGRFLRYIFRINKWKLSKSLGCIHKVEEN